MDSNATVKEELIVDGDLQNEKDILSSGERIKNNTTTSNKHFEIKEEAGILETNLPEAAFFTERTNKDENGTAAINNDFEMDKNLNIKEEEEEEEEDVNSPDTKVVFSTELVRKVRNETVSIKNDLDMDNEVYIKEDGILETDLPDTKVIFSTELVRKVRNETVSIKNDLDMDNKINIKEDDGILETGSPDIKMVFSTELVGKVRNETVSIKNNLDMDNELNIKEEAGIVETGSSETKVVFSTELVRKVRNETVSIKNDLEMDNKTNIKEEAGILETDLPDTKEVFSTELVRKIKNEMATIKNDLEMDNKIKEEPNDSEMGSPNEICFFRNAAEKIQNDANTNCEDFQEDNKLNVLSSDIALQKNRKYIIKDLVIKIEKCDAIFSDYERRREEEEMDVDRSTDWQSEALSASDDSQQSENEDEPAGNSGAAESARHAESGMLPSHGSSNSETSNRGRNGYSFRSKRLDKWQEIGEIVSSTSFPNKQAPKDDDGEHDNDDKRVTCAICSKTFSGKRYLKHHLWNHEGEKTTQM